MELDYKIKEGETIYDASNITLFGMDNIVQGLLIPSDLSFTSITGFQTIYYDENYIQNSTVQLQLNVPKEIDTYTVLSEENQSLYDVCLMNYGTLDEVVKLISDNSNLVSINDVNVSLRPINFSKSVNVKQYVASSIKKRNYSFATLFILDEDSRAVWDGVYDVWDGTYTLTY